MNFENGFSKIEQKLNALRKEGYDRIHIPGGTSKDGSHYCGGVIPVYDANTKTVYFVGVPYDSNFHKRNDENGHTKKSNEMPIETVIREIIEETALSVKPEDLKKLTCSYSIPDNKNIGKSHFKNFYYVKQFTGTLFDFPGPNPIDGETAAPILIPASLFVKVVFKNHLPAVLETIKELKSISAEYAFALMNL